VNPPRDSPAEEFLRLYGAEAWKDWARLRLYFELGEGFAFLILLLPGSTGAEVCRRNLEEFLKGQGKKLHVLDCRWKETVRRLPVHVLDVEPTPELGGIWMGAVIPEADPEFSEWRDAWWWGLGLLNQQRNTLRERYRCPIVLVGAPWLQAVVRDSAPDLWSVRTTVVRIVPSLPPEPQVGLQEVRAAAEQVMVGEAAADPDYAMEQAEYLKSRPGLEEQRAAILMRAGNGFQNLARYDSAVSAFREAELLYRNLAEQNPAPFLTDHAGCLNNLANALSSVGQRREALVLAQESVRVFRQLAADNTEASVSSLALSLNNLGLRLSELARREDALAAADEATRLYRRLAASRPDAFLPYLAGSLNNLGTMLSDLGRREEALAAAEEATLLYRQLAASRPDAFLPGLAGCLNNLGNRLSGLGRREEALAAAEEATRLYRQLAGSLPDALLPKLAASLGARGRVLAGIERHGEAAGSFREGIEALRPLFEALPGAFAPLVRALCHEYLQASRAAGQEPDRELLQAAAAVFEKLEGKGPKAEPQP